MKHSNWADYRNRKWSFLTTLLLGLPLALVLAEFVLIERYGAPGLAWPVGAWALAVCVLGMRWQRFRCPRCADRFFRSSPPLVAMRARRCVHCHVMHD